MSFDTWVEIYFCNIYKTVLSQMKSCFCLKEVWLHISIVINFLTLFIWQCWSWNSGPSPSSNCFPTWATSLALLALGYFSDRFSIFPPPPTSLSPSSSYLGLPRSREYRHVTPHPACLLRRGLINFLPRLALNQDAPDFHLPSSWDYRHVSLCPTYFSLNKQAHKYPCDSHVTPSSDSQVSEQIDRY
jgi:hypothetical protein